MSVLYNLCRMTTATTGTGTITLGSAVSGFLSFTNAQVPDGGVVTYAISDGSNSEIGIGTYTASGTTLSRDTVLRSTNSTSTYTGKITLSGSAQVMITPSAEDILNKTQTTSQTMAGPLSVGTSNAITAGTIELGAASDTTLARVSAGVVSVEGETVHTNSTSRTATVSTIELGHATDTTLSRSAAGELAVEGTIVKKVGKETIYVPAGAMVARTTNGAASGTVETTTNKVMLKTLDFDTSTQEFAQFSIRMPKSWNESTVTAAFTWSHASTTTNFGVVWALEGIALSDDDAGDTAFGTAQQVADTGGTTNDIYVTSATSAITIGGTPAAEDWVVFQVKRVPSDGSDTMAIDARLHGVTVYITTDASTDA